MIYVFGRQYLDIEACAQNLIDSISKDHIAEKSTRMALQVDLIYAHCAGEAHRATLEPELRRHILDDVRDALVAKGVQATYTPIPRRLEPATQAITSLKDVEKSDTPTVILYVGSESLHLANLLITHSFSTVSIYTQLVYKAHSDNRYTGMIQVRKGLLLSLRRPIRC